MFRPYEVSSDMFTGDKKGEKTRLIEFVEYILINLPYNSLLINLAGFSANLRTRKLRQKSSLYKDTIPPLEVQAT